MEADYIDLTLTVEEVEEIIEAESKMHMQVNPERSKLYNELVNHYNDKVEALVTKLKLSLAKLNERTHYDEETTEAGH